MFPAQILYTALKVKVLKVSSLSLSCRNALETELDTKLFILGNVAKQINREGGFLQRIVPAVMRDGQVGRLLNRPRSAEAAAHAVNSIGKYVGNE